ncbi:MAG: response regulator, partial [Myxococcota bacterium]
RQHLDRRHQRHPFTMDETLSILVEIADVLAHIHQHGVVHCDLKPANIILENNPRVVLLDFGLVSSPGQSPVEVSGSPHYMAPERVSSEGPSLTAATKDIYALGVIAFELLVGRKPFEGGSIPEILTKHLAEMPADVSGERADVSTHLARLVAEMLAKDPTQRPSSASALALWLRALQRGCTPTDPGRALRVVIADDDPDMRNLLETCVEHVAPEAELHTCGDGLQALERFHAEPPDLLLFDLHMPEMTGLELAMYLSGTRLADETALVAISGHATENERYLLKRLGINELLNKQVHPDQLVTQLMHTIQKIHDSRR